MAASFNQRLCASEALGMCWAGSALAWRYHRSMTAGCIDTARPWSGSARLAGRGGIHFDGAFYVGLCCKVAPAKPRCAIWQAPEDM
jgi:hypothetical protein